MGALEDFLGGIGSIVSGFINSILALIDGTVQVIQNVIFALITLFTSLLHAVFSLFGNFITFILGNITVLVILAIGWFAYTQFFAESTRAKRPGTKKRA
ncbi:hypothetical protein M407DRAFT_88120 [Tulasnella calospora MUT 4182]|uniref:Uncharacterized protein n=1 Tax=Tulasnella calospora MUT 4182 TaxID=1051891 RepID=A0A0C3LKC7_9AGAM|nr:hypothetical protein M407DRAFT_88120 [Tulasnella calospora MUT 4182]